LTTKLRLLIDADVDPALVKRIAEHAAFNVKYAREIEGLRSDDDVMNYANRDERLVLTLDADFNRHNYRICTHHGIIRFTCRSRHSLVLAEAFQRFANSGHRSKSKHAITFLTERWCEIETLKGKAIYRYP